MSCREWHFDTSDIYGMSLSAQAHSGYYREQALAQVLQTKAGELFVGDTQLLQTAWDSYGQKQVHWVWTCMYVCVLFNCCDRRLNLSSASGTFTPIRKIHWNRKELSLLINAMTVIAFCLFFLLRWRGINYLFAIKRRWRETFTRTHLQIDRSTNVSLCLYNLSNGAKTEISLYEQIQCGAILVTLSNFLFVFINSLNSFFYYYFFRVFCIFLDSNKNVH